MRKNAWLMMVLVIMSLARSSEVRADVSGFDSLFNWTLNVGDAGPFPSYSPGTDTLRLTYATGDVNRRSVFYNSPQAIAEFQAQFIYYELNRASNFGGAFGGTFTIQNSPSGPAALGGNGFGLGYSGIAPSAAISMQIGTIPSGCFPTPSSSGLFFNGSVGGLGSCTLPVNLVSENPIQVTISYSGSTLTQTLQEIGTPNVYSVSYPGINLPAILGSSTAYVGFTASTAGDGGADQYFSGFQFTSIPEPASGLLLALAGALGLQRRNLRFRQG